MPVSTLTIFLLTLGCLVLFAHPAYAFGAGNVPTTAMLENKAFRHGDLEEFLGEIFASYTQEAFQKIYFGNWLRDYSQAMDVTLMNKFEGDVNSILTIVMWLGFKEFPSGAGAYKVTSGRLRVYLPVEHIDNPKGYEGKDGLKGKVDPWAYENLRSKWTPAELDIDPENGMKKYIATKGNGWQTSWKHVYNKLLESVNVMRTQKGQADVDEGLRLLGDALHTLEDFTAHSNWIELCLIAMGNKDVFPLVGDNVRVKAPNGEMVPPLVTGSFGALDLMHSLLGEGSDKVSQGTIGGFQFTTNGKGPQMSLISGMVKDMVSAAGNPNQEQKLNKDMKLLDELATFKPDGKTPGEVNLALYQLFEVHAAINEIIDNILKTTGLEALKHFIDTVKKTMESVIIELISQIAGPSITMTLEGIKEGSDELAKKQDAEPNVFNDPNCSDPTHSQLAKDHFVHCLNEPAGLVAKAIVEYTAKVMQMLYEDHAKDPESWIRDEILSCLWHPMFISDGTSAIQGKMLATLDTYLGRMEVEAKRAMIETLGKDQVRNGKNVRVLPAGGDKDLSISAAPIIAGVGFALATPISPAAIETVIDLAGQCKDVIAGWLRW